MTLKKIFTSSAGINEFGAECHEQGREVKKLEMYVSFGLFMRFVGNNNYFASKCLL